MTFIKQVINTDLGDSDHVGGDDWDILDNYFDDQDQDASRTAKINTKTRFRTGKLQLRNPANTFTTTFTTPAVTADTTAEFVYSAAGLVDHGTNTTKIVNYADIGTISVPGSAASTFVRVYAKQIDANNDGLFIKVKKAGSVTEIQIA